MTSSNTQINSANAIVYNTLVVKHVCQTRSSYAYSFAVVYLFHKNQSFSHTVCFPYQCWYGKVRLCSNFFSDLYNVANRL